MRSHDEEGSALRSPTSAEMLCDSFKEVVGESAIETRRPVALCTVSRPEMTTKQVGCGIV